MADRKKSQVETGVEKLLTQLLTEASSNPSSVAEEGGISFMDRVKLVETCGRWLQTAHKIAPEEVVEGGFSEFFNAHHGAAGSGGARSAKAKGSPGGTSGAAD